MAKPPDRPLEGPDRALAWRESRALLDAGDGMAYTLAVIAAVNTVISAAYYMKVLRTVWMDEAPDGDTSPIITPSPIMAALGITVIGTIAVGVYPRLVAGFGELQDLTGALGVGR